MEATTQPALDARPPAHTIAGELPVLARMALPLVLTNAGNMLLGLVDVAVVGRLGDAAIAGAGLGNAIYFTAALFGLGTLFGLDPLLSQAIGAGDRRGARAVLTQGLWLAALLSVPLALVIALVAWALPWLGQEPEVAASARAYVLARLPSLLPFLGLTAMRAYLQALNASRALVVGVVLANVVNLPVAIALSFGVPAIGLPAMGVQGAGLAATVATVVQLAVALAPLRVLDRERGLSAMPRGLDRPALARAFRLGAPIGAQIVLEAGSFSIVAFLVGTFGRLPLGAHQIALTCVSCTFQIALGVSAATSVRVGSAVGQGDRLGARTAGVTGIVLGGAGMLAGAAIFGSVPRVVARALTDRPELVEAAVPFLIVAACFQLSDGVQTVSQGALRGAGDTRWPFLLNALGHYGIGLPIALALTYLLHLGAVGLWWGLSAGLTAVAVAMTVRFVRVSGRPIARV
ncbi:MAG: MATE family efflux transporter [Sandaracinus sp.]